MQELNPLQKSRLQRSRDIIEMTVKRAANVTAFLDLPFGLLKPVEDGVLSSVENAAPVGCALVHN